jgi:predicted alpha/beta-hydrolase family hydrolase
MSRHFRFDVDGEQLTAQMYPAVKPIGATLLLGHGASAGQRDHFIVDYATSLAERGVLVVTYDFPFIEHGRRTPDRNEVLEECCRAAIVAARQCRPKNRLFIGGKSLGGRVASEVAAEGGAEAEDIAGLVLLGYPLHAIGKSGTSRSRHLRELSMPVFFAQGTRDVFGTPAELEPLVRALPKRSQLHVVEGGDHSFAIPARARRGQAAVHAEIQDDIVQWMSLVMIAPSARERAAARPRPVASRVRTQLRALRRPASRASS